jgi:hypothetical protein
MKRGGWGRWLGVVGLLTLPLPALAQTAATSGGYYAPDGTYVPAVTRSPLPPSGFGTEVSLGGGLMNFMNGAARGLTNVGGSWALRLGIGTRSVLGVEAAYIGTAQGLNAEGLDPDAVLVGNGVEGALRLNIPIATYHGMVEPFGLAGIGWNQFDVVNDDFNNSIVRERDRLWTVPLGAGLAYSYRGVMFDARYTYRLAYGDEMLGGADMRNWIVSANLGSEF